MNAHRGYRVGDVIFLNQKAAESEAAHQTETAFGERFARLGYASMLTPDCYQVIVKVREIWFIETDDGRAVELLGGAIEINRRCSP